MFGRTRKGKPVPPGQWYWPDQRTHPAIVDREVWEAAQKVGAEHRSSRDGAIHNPANWRSYPFRSRVRCKMCKRRMCGLTKVHAQNKTPTEYAYYVCQFNPRTPSHVAAAPDHPRTVQVREDVLLSGDVPRPSRPTRWRPAGNSAWPSSSRTPPPPGKPSTTGRPPPSAKRLKRLTARQDNLMRELDDSFDMADEAGEQYRRRIRADYATLHSERKDIETQLTELAADTTPAPAPDLVSLLPEVTADLAALPPGLQAELFDVFDIQIIWNAPMRQATFRATITDTTPSIVTALLTRAGDDPSHSTKVWPPENPATPAPQQTPAPHLCRDPFTSLYAENSARKRWLLRGADQLGAAGVMIRPGAWCRRRAGCPARRAPAPPRRNTPTPDRR